MQIPCTSKGLLAGGKKVWVCEYLNYWIFFEQCFLLYLTCTEILLFELSCSAGQLNCFTQSWKLIRELNPTHSWATQVTLDVRIFSVYWSLVHSLARTLRLQFSGSPWKDHLSPWVSHALGKCAACSFSWFTHLVFLSGLLACLETQASECIEMHYSEKICTYCTPLCGVAQEWIRSSSRANSSYDWGKELRAAMHLLKSGLCTTFMPLACTGMPHLQGHGLCLVLYILPMQVMQYHLVSHIILTKRIAAIFYWITSHLLFLKSGSQESTQL